MSRANPRWNALEDLFFEALETPPQLRTAKVRALCDGDAELEAEVHALLQAHDSEMELLDPDIVALGLSLLVGETPAPEIDRYRVGEKIGEGGMASVFLAERSDQDFRQKVAIKVLHATLGNAGLIHRFLKERRILASLVHPYIARLQDGGFTVGGAPYIAMEHVEGMPVTDFCSKKSLSIPDRLRLFLKICEAVRYAHQNLVVHRDLKPSNILVTETGEPKLLDFGIAKLLPSEGPQFTTQTLAQERALTPAYASPEQITGATITTGTDVYSLGVVLYQLLTGHLPHPQRQGEAPADFLKRICEEVPKRPSQLPFTEDFIKNAGLFSPRQLRRRLAGDLDLILLAALRKEPAQRFTSVEQFADDVQRHLTGLPIRARQTSALYRASRFVRRHRWQTAAALLFAATLFMGAGGVAWEAAAARRAQMVAETQRKKAEVRAARIRDLSNRFIQELAKEIEQLPGGTDTREKLIREGLKNLDALAAEQTTDLALAIDLAIAYRTYADLQGRVETANKGHIPEAISSYRKAILLFEKAYSEDPRPETAYEIAGSQIRISALLQRSGKLREAKVAFESADHWIAKHPSRSDQDGFKVRRAFKMRGISLTTATEEYLAAIELGQRMLAEDATRPTERPLPDARFLMANDYALLAEGFDARLDLFPFISEAATRSARDQFRSILKDSTGPEPSPIPAKTDKELETIYLLLYETTMGNQPTADQLLASIESMKKKAKADPRNREATYRWLFFACAWGRVCIQQDRLQTGISTLSEVIREYETLLKESPNNQEFRKNQTAAHFFLGLGYEKNGNAAVAVNHYLTALKLSGDIIQSAPLEVTNYATYFIPSVRRIDSLRQIPPAKKAEALGIQEQVLAALGKPTEFPATLASILTLAQLRLYSKSPLIRDVRAGLALAREAVARTGGREPHALATLALAQALNGSDNKMRESIERLLKVSPCNAYPYPDTLPATAAETLRRFAKAAND